MEKNEEMRDSLIREIRKYALIGAGAGSAVTTLLVGLLLYSFATAIHQPVEASPVTPEAVSSRTEDGGAREEDPAAGATDILGALVDGVQAEDSVTTAPMETAAEPAGADLDDLLGIVSGKSALKEKTLSEKKKEAEQHLSSFQTLFFSLDMSKDDLPSVMKKALPYGDESVRAYYKSLQERKYFEKLANLGAVQTLELKKVSVDTSSEPWSAVSEGVLTVSRKQGTTLYDFKSTCGITEEGDGTYLIRDYKVNFSRKQD